MTFSLKHINEHELLKSSKKNFNSVFEQFQKLKEDDSPPEYLDLVFFIETQVAETYFQQLVKNLEIIVSTEPNIIIFESNDKETELMDMALIQFMETLSEYKNFDIDRLLKCTFFI